MVIAYTALVYVYSPQSFILQDGTDITKLYKFMNNKNNYTAN